jgi:uncharacterized protein YprB with RNaseH-like and TPR domain
MSSMRERLLRHKASGSGHKAAAEAVVPEAAADTEWSAIGAHMEHNEWGSFVMRRLTYDGGTMHGRYALNELFGQSDRLTALLGLQDLGKAAVDVSLSHERLLYLDTETTGLGVGAGNVAFMIGIGFYDGEQFIVEQMFIRDPGEELGMLHYLQQKVGEHPYLVTYNGKTFDWPLIKNRYILNRMQAELPLEGHLDFLYPSRSLWKHTLPSCRLGKVEEERLGVSRHNDVPGSMAPMLYFQYLAERDVSVVQGVFQHNELDILSLAGLSIHFTRVLGGKSDYSVMGHEELFRLGIWLDKMKQEWLSAQALEQLTTRIREAALSDDNSTIEYILPLAQVFKQQHRYGAARGLWELYIDHRGERSTAPLEPFIELSIHYEHREKQHGLALEYAQRALDKAWRHQALKRSYGTEKKKAGRETSVKADKKQDEIDSLEKRIVRLRQKVLRAENRQLKSANKSIRRSRTASGGLEDLLDKLI